MADVPVSGAGIESFAQKWRLDVISISPCQRSLQDIGTEWGNNYRLLPTAETDESVSSFLTRIIRVKMSKAFIETCDLVTPSCPRPCGSWPAALGCRLISLTKITASVEMVWTQELRTDDGFVGFYTKSPTPGQVRRLKTHFDIIIYTYI